MAIRALIERVQNAFSKPARLGDSLVTISASIGSVSAALDYQDAEDLLRAADHDMYRVKRNRAQGRPESPD